MLPNREVVDGNFDRIALSLSGGGFRAVAFHLGVLRFLHRIDLLRNVRALSTASGGSLTGAAYAQALARRQPFEEFDRSLYRFLCDIDVIDAALAAVPQRGKLISAAADVYATLLKVTLGEVQQSADHLEEIAFNATDMANGLSFRFVKTGNRFVRSGNRETPLSREVAAQVRLADIVAASSCFPAAFEPMVFPLDFHGGTAAGPGVPLMDGGIFDNQGIDALLLVRSRRRQEIDKIVVSDADAGVPPLYEEPLRRRGLGVRVWMIFAGIAAFAAASIVSVALLLQSWRANLLPAIVSAVTSLLALILLFVIFRITRMPIANRTRPLLWRHIMRLRVPDLVTALDSRFRSLVALTARLFMKRVRTLTYKRLFDRFATSHRTIGNLLNTVGRAPEATEEMRRIASRAAEMPTTLWFDDEQQLRELVATGEMTICLSLLRHIARVKGPLPETAARLRDRCKREWDRFREKPLG